MAPAVIPPPSVQEDTFYDAASSAECSPPVPAPEYSTATAASASAAGNADLNAPFQSVELWSDFDWSVVTYVQLGKEAFTSDMPSVQLPVRRQIGQGLKGQTPCPPNSPASGNNSPASSTTNEVAAAAGPFPVLCMQEVMASMDSICKMAEIFLEKQQIMASFSRQPAPFQIGCPDVTLKLEESAQPVMVGMYTTDQDFMSMASDDFFLITMNTCAKDSPNSKAVELVHKTYTHMALNNLRYGFISTSTYTRFLRRTSAAPGFIEVSPVITMFQSSPYTIMGSLVAMGLQCKLGSPRRAADTPQFSASNLLCYQQNHRLGHYTGARIDDFFLESGTLSYPLHPICLPTPITYNLGHASKTVPGRPKWWRIMQAKKLACRVHFTRTNAGTSHESFLPVSVFSQINSKDASMATVLPHQWGVYQCQLEITENEIHSDTKDEYEMLQHNDIRRGHRRYRGLNSCVARNSVSTYHVVLKTVDYSSGTSDTQMKLFKLENEARIYEHFQAHDKQHNIPKLRMFGDMLGFLRVLAVEPCGRQLTVADFKAPSDTTTPGHTNDSILMLIQKMRSALSDVHATGVLHRDIRLSNFVIDDSTANGRVRVINFGCARLYVRLYPQAMQDELAVMNEMCKAAMRGQLPDEFV